MPIIPEPVSKGQLISILSDVISRIANDDSFEGYISYTIPDISNDEEKDADFMLEARYRVGNRNGQGGMNIIGKIVSQDPPIGENSEGI